MQWRGHAWLGSGVLIFRGEVGDADQHRHGAHQLLFMDPGGSVVAELTGGRAVGPVDKIAVPSGTAHRLAPTGSVVTGLTVYVDISSAAGRDLQDRLGDDTENWITCAQRSAAAWGVPNGPYDAETIAGVIADELQLMSDRSTTSTLHPYVRSALDVIDLRLPGTCTLNDVAAAVGVSASHLGRLWRQQLRLPFTAWIRWARLRQAAGLLSTGASITDAAHGAGFADSAHANRACHAMFGVSPSTIVDGITLI